VPWIQEADEPAILEATKDADPVKEVKVK